MRTSSPTPSRPSRARSGPRPVLPDDRGPLAHSLGRRVDVLTGHLDAALDGQEHAIHQARVASRRLREIVPIVVPPRSKGGGRLRHRLKRLTGALGPVRELDVASALLTMRAGGKAAPAVVALRAHLTVRRAAALDALRDAIGPRRSARLRERLTDLAGEVDRLAPRGQGERGQGELAERQRRRLALRVIDRARCLGNAVVNAGALLVVDRVHAVRIAAKRLRYALELTGELKLARTAALVTSLKTVQDVLGELHDLDVLRHEAARVRSDLPPDSIVAKDLEQMSQALDADIRQLHARYLRGARALAALTDRVRDRIAPCLDSSIST
jgi:CHAD domain-containing protein